MIIDIIIQVFVFWISQFIILSDDLMNIITAEHIWFIITEISEASKCTDRVSLATAYFLTVYHEIFSIFPYSLPVAFSLAVLNTLLTCAWNFMDLFIILLSHALAMRFQQINHRLMGIRGKASLNNLCMVILPDNSYHVF